VGKGWARGVQGGGCLRVRASGALRRGVCACMSQTAARGRTRLGLCVLLLLRRACVCPLQRCRCRPARARQRSGQQGVPRRALGDSTDMVAQRQAGCLSRFAAAVLRKGACVSVTAASTAPRRTLQVRRRVCGRTRKRRMNVQRQQRTRAAHCPPRHAAACNTPSLAAYDGRGARKLETGPRQQSRLRDPKSNLGSAAISRRAPPAAVAWVVWRCSVSTLSARGSRAGGEPARRRRLRCGSLQTLRPPPQRAPAATLAAAAVRRPRDTPRAPWRAGAWARARCAIGAPRARRCVRGGVIALLGWGLCRRRCSLARGAAGCRQLPPAPARRRCCVSWLRLRAHTRGSGAAA
jgi:hypothetical protein